MVHANALAATSTQIDCLINGEMKEAAERCAELPALSVDDFARFCEYAYCGDYAAPDHATDEARLCSKLEHCSKSSLPDRYEDIPEPQSTEIIDDFAQTEPAPLMDDWPGGFKSKKGKTSKPSKKSIFRTNFQNRNYISRPEYEAETTDRFKPHSNTSDEQDFTPVFLAHARLYAFARMRLVDTLIALTLKKLHDTLVGFQLFEQRVGDIIELARYAYSNEHIPDRADDGKIDELRDLVVNYVASEFDIIGKTAIFITFLEEGGEFVSDFWGTLLNHLL